MAGHFFTQPRHILGIPVEPVHGFQRGSGIVLHNGPGQLKQMLSAGKSCRFIDYLYGDFPAVSQTLIQQGKSISKGTICKSGNEQRSRFIQRSVFVLRNIMQPGGNILRCNPVEVKPLTAGKNSGRNPVHLCGGQNKQHMSRRFFQSFEQCVVGPRRKHMYFVDDVHPVFGGSGGKNRFFPQFPDAVHTVVAGRVDFYNIHHRAAVNAPAHLAFAAGVSVDRVETVDRLGQNFGAGGLAGSPGTGEQIGVRDSSGHQLIAQGGGHLRLACHIGKDLRTPFTIKNLIHRETTSCFC